MLCVVTSPYGTNIGTWYRASCYPAATRLENDFARGGNVSSLICTTFVLRGNARKRPGRFPLMTGPFSGGTRAGGGGAPAARRAAVGIASACPCDPFNPSFACGLSSLSCAGFGGRCVGKRGLMTAVIRTPASILTLRTYETKNSDSPDLQRGSVSQFRLQNASGPSDLCACPRPPCVTRVRVLLKSQSSSPRRSWGAEK